MAFYYFDTRALVKRYVTEIGSTWVEQVCAAQDETLNERINVILVSELTFVEVAAAIAKRVHKTKELDTQKGEDAYALFVKQAGVEYQLVPLTTECIHSAAALAHKHALRAYDALQLALGVHADALLKENELTLPFVAADKVLLQTAQSEGLATDSPHHHADLDQQPSN